MFIHSQRSAQQTLTTVTVMASNLYYLSVGLGLLFLAAGMTKVVPIEPAYGTHVSGFNKFVSVFPLQSFTGYRPTADVYRSMVAVAEIACGVLLAFGNPKWHRLSSFVLLALMVGAAYTLLALGEPPQSLLAPAIVGGLLFFLITRERHYNY